MTFYEIIMLVLSVISIVSLNICLKKGKVVMYAKNEWIYMCLLKIAQLAPAMLTVLQIYCFTFDYVNYLRSDMYHMVMFYYIGYLLLMGFLVFMEDLRLILGSGVLLLIYQCYIAYILISHEELISLMMDNVYNLFRYGTGVGIFLSILGPILSLLGILSIVHYEKASK